MEYKKGSKDIWSRTVPGRRLSGKKTDKIGNIFVFFRRHRTILDRFSMSFKNDIIRLASWRVGFSFGSGRHFSFGPFLAVQGFTLFLIVFLVASILFLPQNGTVSVIQTAVVKQTTTVVAGGNPVHWTLLVKKSDISDDSYLVLLPKSARQVKVSTVTKAEAQALLKSEKAQQLSLNQREAIAKSNQPKQYFAASILDSISKYFLSSLEDGVETMMQAADPDVQLTPDAVVVDLSSEIQEPVPEPEPTKQEEKEEAKEEKQEAKQEDKDKDNEKEPEPEPAPEEIPVSTAEEPQPLEPEASELTPEPEPELPSELPTDEPIIETTSPSTEQPIEIPTEPIIETTSPSDQPVIEPEPVAETPEAEDDYVSVEYTTPAPQITEEQTDTGKLVTVSSEDSPNQPQLTDVLASTKIPEFFRVGQENKIKIKWKNNNDQNVTFQAYDTDDNGKLDYVEWTVPHLSEQIFEIIFISKAWQLDSNLNILADIYDQTVTKNDVWAQLTDGQYVRATFNKILDNTKDNTVYAKPTNPDQPVTIQVYPVYDDGQGNLTQGPLLTTFDLIDHEDTYKVLLIGLATPTDIFDLKVSGNVDIDWIVDPTNYVDPDGDAANDNWSVNTNLYQNLDDGTRQPTAPAGGDNIGVDGDTDASGPINIDMSMTTFTIDTSVTEITIWTYINAMNNSTIKGDIYLNGTWVGEQTIYDASGFEEPGWQSTTFSSLSATQSDIDDLRVRISLQDNAAGYVSAVYAAVTDGAGTTNVDPNGDLYVKDWVRADGRPSTDTYTGVDDALRQPDSTWSPDNTYSDWIKVDPMVAGGTVDYNMTTIAVGNEVVSIKVWVYIHWLRYGNINTDIYVDGDWLGAQQVYSQPAEEHPVGWKSYQFTGSWTQSDIDNLKVRINYVDTEGNYQGWAFISEVYAEMTYTVAISNTAPNATSVSDAPDPVAAGSNVTFTGGWTESDSGDQVKMYVCNSSDCTNCSNTTQTGCWCNSSSYQTEPDVSDTCAYTAQAGDEGANSYWLGVCDDEPACDATPFSGGTFTVDATPPAPTVTGVGGDSASPWSTSDTTPTITLTLNEDGDCYASETDEAYDDMSNDVNCTGDGGTSITCQITSALAESASKTIYVACKDTPGNKDTIATNEHITMEVDATPPTISNFSPANAAIITDSTPTVTFTTNENGDCFASADGDETYDEMSDDTNCTGDGGTSHSCTLGDLGSSGSKTIYFSCKDDTDATNNKDTALTNDTVTYTLDTTTPDIVAVDAGASSGDRTSLTSNTWFKYTDTGSDDQLSFSWTDPPSVSGDTFYYELNATATDTITGDESTTTNPYIDSITVTEGTNYFHVRPKNGAGTWGTERTFIVKYDKTAPVTTADGNGYTFGTTSETSVTVTLTCADTSGAGCSATFYCTDTADTCTPTTAYTGDVTVSAQGTSYIRYASTDNASNSETAGSQTIVIGAPTPAPSTPVGNPPAGSYESTQQIALTSADSTSIRYTIDGTAPTCSTGTVYSSLIAVSVTTTIKAIGCNAGGASSVASLEYVITGGVPGPAYHNICSNQQCISVSGGGFDECTVSADCSIHNECNAQRQCVQVTGQPAPNACLVNSDCLQNHTECNGVFIFCRYSGCSGMTCVQVAGPGNNECSVDDDCTAGIHNECNTRKQCVLADGIESDSCILDADCSLTHNICQDGLCSVASGIGIDECVEDSECQMPGSSYHACNANNQCVELAGSGVDACQTDTDCNVSHSECEAGQCVQVNGLGISQCQADDDCILPVHNECNAQGQCFLASGAGFDACQTSNDCNLIYHECAAGQCIQKSGVGTNQCQTNSDCVVPMHNQCNAQKQCVSVSGAGPDTCQADSDCGAILNFHLECDNNQQCVSVGGAGADQCKTASDCGGTGLGRTSHNECTAEDKCVLVDGAGFDQCGADSDCLGILPPIPVMIETITEVIFQKIPQQVAIVAKEVKKIVQSPEGSVITKTISTTGFVVATVATGFAFPIFELLLIPLRMLGVLLTTFGLKKRVLPWGVVYDSVTKQPLDPAYVVLKDLNGKTVATAITDLDGRYGFLAGPGNYKIFARKTNYTFPSKKLGGKTNDELYRDLYFGQTIEIKSSSEVIVKNLPMDPVKFDWNEFAKKGKKLMKFYSERDIILGRIYDFLFGVGFIVGYLAFIFAPYPYNTAIVILYLFILALRVFGIQTGKYGYITEKSTGEPMSFALVRVLMPGTNVLVASKSADKYGRYYCLVAPGKYYVKIEKKNIDGSYTSVFTSQPIDVSKRGIIKEKFKI